ncbi:MAG: hypothetical protein LBV28_05180 [Puniceicoccales bacterium]|nr:hypothetical protein [Puniceicoccales bacterium]
MFNFFKTHTGGRLHAFAAPLLPFAATAAGAVETQPEGTILFGNKWLALAVILAGVALLTALVAALGRYLAATHPDSLNNTSK